MSNTQCDVSPNSVCPLPCNTSNGQTENYRGGQS